MNDLELAIKHLQAMKARMEKRKLPSGDMGLNDALTVLDDCFGDKYYSVDLTVNHLHNIHEVEWSVWDGSKHHRAKYLRDAVKLAVDQVTPQDGSELLAAQAAVA